MADTEDRAAEEETEIEEAASTDSAAEKASDEKSSGDKPEQKAAEDKPAKKSEEKSKSEDKEAAEDDKAKDKGAASAAQRVRAGFSVAWAAAAAVIIALCVVIVFGYHKNQDTTNKLKAELAQVHQVQADRDTATKMARDYALKSLTYTYQDPDAFFKSVSDGVAPTLKDKYANVADLLKGIMVQAKVESTGEILSTDATLQPGGIYQVVVSASQTTRNLQNPQPRVSTIILQVVINKIGNAWQISDIGPKAGSKPLIGDQTAPVGPGGVPGAVPPAKPGAAPAIPGLH